MHKLASLTFVLLAACTSYDPDLGATPFLCGTAEPRCPENYSCMDSGGKEICVKNGGVAPDSGPVGFQCSDDSALGQNDTIAGAFVTPVSTSSMDFKLAGLAICPEGDKDTYAINLGVANKGLKAITSWESGNPIKISLLNAGGTSIANGTAMGDKALQACAPNLPTGTYYAQAFADATTKNNYKLEIIVVDNCL